MPKRGFGSSALIVVIVVMIFAVVIFAVTPMMFVPTAVLSPVMAPIIVLIPVAVVVAPPITVMIATLGSIPILAAAAAWAAIARCGTPRSAAARAKHVARLDRDGKQMALWADMRTASRDHMETAFQQRRQQIVGDCHQLK